MSEHEKKVNYARANENTLNNKLTDLEDEISKGRDEQTTIKQKITITEGEIDDHNQKLLKNQERESQIQREIWKQHGLNKELNVKLVVKNREIDHTVENKKRCVDDQVKRGNIQLLSLRTIFDKLISKRNSNERDTDAESRISKIERLQVKIKEDVKGIDELNQERTDLYRDIDQTEYQLRQVKTSLEAVKSNTECLEKDNNCLKNDFTKHAERNEGKFLTQEYG